jgi:membrane protein YqaA with SNARE-associated domain
MVIAPSLDLWALLIGSFLAPTLVPGAAESLILLLAQDQRYPVPELLAVATLGNTLGGLSNWALGSFAARRWSPVGSPRVQAWVARFGSPVLLLSWMPLVGDALCLAAGLLRLNFWRSLLCIAAGKMVRYALVLAAFKAVI